MNVLELFAPITTFVFDVDGVLTNGSLQLTEDGQLLRSMNIKDAYALQLAVKMGYQVWIITNGDSQAVRDKFLKAGLQQVHIAVKRKKDVLLQLVEETGIPLSQMLFMGDDLPDHACMRSVA
ncbi:MAG: 3-deoxy-D-manno-octulosonate 8-phosphate phosphatase, partial [Chitinophagia bacterium]|nr:3-deoxy-D-manno-octulosonate 8-phosphate phosphatase [Chitinophagia bacterium]